MHPERYPVGLDIQFDVEADAGMWNMFLDRLAAAEWDMQAALNALPEWTRMWFAEHTISFSLLHKLMSDSSASVRREVADSPYTTPADLDILARDADEMVRCYVAQNVNTSLTTLASLAQDRSSRVRCSAALHPHATSAMLRHLAHDDNPFVRLNAITHPAADPSLFWSLRNDPNSRVRRAARTRLEARRRQGERR